jgi:hypothetical protein
MNSLIIAVRGGGVMLKISRDGCIDDPQKNTTILTPRGRGSKSDRVLNVVNQSAIRGMLHFLCGEKASIHDEYGSKPNVVDPDIEVALDGAVVKQVMPPFVSTFFARRDQIHKGSNLITESQVPDRVLCWEVANADVKFLKSELQAVTKESSLQAINQVFQAATRDSPLPPLKKMISTKIVNEMDRTGLSGKIRLFLESVRQDSSVAERVLTVKNPEKETAAEKAASAEKDAAKKRLKKYSGVLYKLAVACARRSTKDKNFRARLKYQVNEIKTGSWSSFTAPGLTKNWIQKKHWTGVRGGPRHLVMADFDIYLKISEDLSNRIQKGPMIASWGKEGVAVAQLIAGHIGEADGPSDDISITLNTIRNAGIKIRKTNFEKAKEAADLERGKKREEK